MEFAYRAINCELHMHDPHLVSSASWPANYGC